MTVIELTDNLYIAKGAERKCYIYPTDPTKLLKIQYSNQIDRNQNDLDTYYYNYLKNKNASFEHIPKLYGTVQTNQGEALVYDIIKDFNGNTSKSFENIIKEKQLSNKLELILLTELKSYLSTNNIVFGDVVLSNILCQETQQNQYKLIVIDGLGARRFGWKLWLHMNSKLFTKFRIEKQWNKLMKNYALIKKEMD